MFTLYDPAGTYQFGDLAKLKQYLAETSSTEYAMEVIEWACSDKPSLQIQNGTFTDSWCKGWGVTERA